CRPVTGRNPRRAVGVVGRALIEGKTGTEVPLLVQLVGGAYGVGPSVMPILFLGDSTEVGGSRRTHALVFHYDGFQAAPAREHGTRVERPLIAQLMGNGNVDGFWGFKLQRRIVLSIGVGSQWTQGWITTGYLGIAFQFVVQTGRRYQDNR